MLTERQLLTLKHLQEAGYKTPEQVVDWCVEKIRQKAIRGNVPKKGRRKHSKLYYAEIVVFMTK